jgi:hypothetical protein
MSKDEIIKAYDEAAKVLIKLGDQIDDALEASRRELFKARKEALKRASPKASVST